MFLPAGSGKSAVQEQLAEVEDVLIAAAEASGHGLPEIGTRHADT
jgi:hypothetical protein